MKLVDDGEEEPGDRVVITISTKEVKKPEGSSLVGKTPMFESKEEDDPEIKKQIEAALDAMGLMEELMLSEHDDESESESSDDDGKDDLDETKQYYKDQEEGTGEPGSKPSSPKAVNTGPAAVPESVGNPTVSRPDAPSGNTLPAKPGATKGKGPSNESSGKGPCFQIATFSCGPRSTRACTVHSLQCSHLGTGSKCGRGYRLPLEKLYRFIHRTAKTGGHPGKWL